MTADLRLTRACLVLWFASMVLMAGGTPARAQEPAVSLTLLEQTPWSMLDEEAPERAMLSIAVLATNTGTQTLEDLTLDLTIGPNFTSRLQYETSLTAGPSYAVHEESFGFRGKREPGRARTFTIQMDLSRTSGISQTETLIYPARISLTAEGQTVAYIDTPILYFVREPEAPVLFSAWLELDAPVAMGPEGLLEDASFEAALSPGSSLTAAVQALREVTSREGSPSPIGVAVEPSLVEQAERMSKGYSRSDGTQVPAGEGAALAADRFLSDLSDALNSAGVQVVSVPFSGPSLPALIAAGLDGDASRQYEAARRQLQGSLGVTLDTTITRPPGGHLSSDSLTWLAGSGVTTVLADPDEVERPVQPGQFAPPPTATVDTAAGQVTLVLPDPGVQALLNRPELTADPVLGAQAVLGELAVIWKERPVPEPPEVRGLALGLPSTLPPAIWGPLLDRLSEAPFLRLVRAQDLASGVNPPGPAATLGVTTSPVYSAAYASQLRSLRLNVEAYTSMLTEPGDIPERLERDLLYAEAGEFAGNEPAGERWLDAVAEDTFQAFRGATPQVEQIFTFTSREGSIPLRMGDPGPVPLKVTILLQSTQFEFPDGPRQEVLLERPDQIVTFRAVAKAAGRNPIRVLVFSPSGQAISQQTLVVQTTAANRIAVIVTASAATVLALLYSRRWVGKRRRT